MIRLFAVLAAIVLIGGSCGGGSEGPPGSETPGGSASPLAEPGEGALIISTVDQIIERDLESDSEKVLASAEAANSFLLDAAPSRDGSRIVYINQPPSEIVDGRFDAGSNLWVMDRDGSNARLVFEHVDANQLVRFPRWEDDGHVLAIVTELSSVDGVTRVLYTLQRFDVETGERERVLENVLAFDVSPDGERVVYAEFQTPTGEVLEAAALDGTQEVELVGQDQQLQPFGYPRFSPNGAEVAFASADQTGASAVRQRESVVLRSAEGPAEPHRAISFDGLPQDIWTVEASGGRAVRVADLKEDLPALTWDGSGERIYVLGVEGLYDINVSTGDVTRMGEGIFHAQISWAPIVD